MKKVIPALATQVVFALIVLGLTVVSFKKFGATNFQEISTLCSVYIIVNYFDLGYIGMARRIASEPGFSLAHKFDHVLRLAGNSVQWVILLEAVLFFGWILVARLALGHMKALENPDNLFIAIALAPGFLYVSMIRAFMEGTGRILASNIIRGGIGVIIVGSPFVAQLILKNWHLFFYIPPVFAFTGIAGCLLYASHYRRQEGTPMDGLLLSQVGWMEVVFTLAGVFFLYSDRFIFLFVGRSEEIGRYLLAIDIATRTSLLYVPVAIFFYPKIIQAYRSGQDGLSLFRKSVLGSAGVTTAAYMGLALLAIVFRRYIPAKLLNPQFCLVFVLIAAGQVFISINYSCQRLLTLAVPRLKSLAIRYCLMVSIFTCVLTLSIFWLGVWVAPIIFLLRAVSEQFMLRRTIREAINHGDL